MADTSIYMTHPDIPGQVAGPLSRQSFETLWSNKGWVLAEDEEVTKKAEADRLAEEHAANITAEEVDAISKRAALDEVALLRKIDPTEYPNMDTLREAIKATL